jgi:DNA-binding response OmpR family regulator
MSLGRALVVDDEVPLARIVGSYLEREGFEVTVTHDGATALELARRERPLLIVLDIMLPGLDGIAVCEKLREFTDAYILMLTASDAATDKVRALSNGADDYLVKPFSSQELVARSHAMLRRPRGPRGTHAAGPERIHVGALALDTHSRTVALDGRDVHLTRTEYDILELLVRADGAVVSRESIIGAIRGGEWFGDPQVVDAHVARLRAKIGDGGRRPRFVLTVRGVGYRLGAV